MKNVKRKLVMGVLFEAGYEYLHTNGSMACLDCQHWAFERRVKHYEGKVFISRLIQGLGELGLNSADVAGGVRASLDSGSAVYTAFKLDPNEDDVGQCVPIEVLIDVAVSLLEDASKKRKQERLQNKK